MDTGIGIDVGTHVCRVAVMEGDLPRLLEGASTGGASNRANPSLELVARLREQAGASLGHRVTLVCMSVPVCLSRRPRLGLLEVVAQSGFDRIRLLDDSSAAALALVVDRPDDASTWTLLIAGGGYCEASVVDVGAGLVEVRAVAGAPLAGDDWPAVVRDLLSQVQKEAAPAGRVAMRGATLPTSAARELVESVCGQTPELLPEDSIAKGCAIEAARLSGRIYDPVLLETTYRTLCVELSDGTFKPIVRRHAQMPVSGVIVVSVADLPQGEVRLVETDDSAEAEMVGRLDVSRDGPTIQVVVEIDSLRRIRAVVQGEGKGTAVPMIDTPPRPRRGR